MNIEIRREDGAATLAPHGDIVASSVPELRPALRELVREGVGGVTVDLAETAMIDSTGLGLLIATYNSLMKSKGRFALVNASPEILELLQAMRIHQHFEVGGRLEEAG